MNLKLSQMGLILLGIPAVFEVLFVIVLVLLLHQAEQDIKHETHSREVIAHAHTLVERITNAAISIGAYGFSKSPLAKSAFEAAVNGMHSELRTLTGLLKGNSSQVSKLLAINNTVEHALAQIKEARVAIETSSTLSLLSGDTRMSDNLEKLSASVGTLQQQIDDLVHAEESLHRDLPAKRARSRQEVLIALLAGTFLNIGLAVALAIFFSRTIAERHLVLVDNSNRLALSQALHPPLAGNDEIAQLDRAFHQMVDDLQEADRYKKQLIAMVSHELRAPLTSIDAILTFLEAGGAGELPAGAPVRLRTAQSETQRLISLINDLLDLERMEAGKFEMHFELTAIAPVIQRASAAVEGALEKKKLILSIPDTGLCAWSDQDRLVQVLVNLLSNAIKFSPEGATITISALDLPDFVELRVNDQGPGIPQASQHKLFQRFSQLETADAKNKGGSGLGLSICKTIISQHGGNIGVESDGKGASFWFQIPKKEPAS